LGVAPNTIGEVIGIFKAYTTRVGSGPFPTELFDEVGARIGNVGKEFGATTGRPRRCGWLDLVGLKYAIRINGVTQLIMMKSDVLSGIEEIKVCTAYQYKGETISHFPYSIEPEVVQPFYQTFKGWKADITAAKAYNDFPKELKAYVDFLEENIQVPIKMISVGPDRTQTVFR